MREHLETDALSIFLRRGDVMNESGILIVNDPDEQPIDDGMTITVCPCCGSEDAVVRYKQDEDWTSVRCWGGFGIKEYRYVLHKCKSCGAKFAAWKTTKTINQDIVVAYIAYTLLMAISLILRIVSIAHDLNWIGRLLCIVQGLIIILLFALLKDESNSYKKDIGPEIIYSVMGMGSWGGGVSVNDEP